MNINALTPEEAYEHIKFAFECVQADYLDGNCSEAEYEHALKTMRQAEKKIEETRTMSPPTFSEDRT